MQKFNLKILPLTAVSILLCGLETCALSSCASNTDDELEIEYKTTAEDLNHHLFDSERFDEYSSTGFFLKYYISDSAGLSHEKYVPQFMRYEIPGEGGDYILYTCMLSEMNLTFKEAKLYYGITEATSDFDSPFSDPYLKQLWDMKLSPEKVTLFKNGNFCDNELGLITSISICEHPWSGNSYKIEFSIPENPSGKKRIIEYQFTYQGHQSDYPSPIVEKEGSIYFLQMED